MLLPSSSGRSPASELILTDRGTVYHIELPPDAVPDTIITVGDPGRVPAVSRYFDTIEVRKVNREFVSHVGRIGAHRVLVISTGIGTGNIDIVLTELDALVNLDLHSGALKKEYRHLRIISLGTAGSLQPDLPVDSMVVTSLAIGLDNMLHFYRTNSNPEEHFLEEEFSRQGIFTSSTIHPYVAEGSIALRRLFGSPFQHGLTLTAPGFYGAQGRHIRAPHAFPSLLPALSAFRNRDSRILNMEMETAALYGLGRVLGHSCVSVSTIVANRTTGTFSSDSEAAVDKMIREVLPLLFP